MVNNMFDLVKTTKFNFNVVTTMNKIILRVHFSTQIKWATSKIK